MTKKSLIRSDRWTRVNGDDNGNDDYEDDDVDDKDGDDDDINDDNDVDDKDGDIDNNDGDDDVKLEVKEELGLIRSHISEKEIFIHVYICIYLWKKN